MTDNDRYASIKDLVFETVHRKRGKVDYENLSAAVLHCFPSSHWNPSHWAWYRSQIRAGRFPGEFTEEERDNLGRQPLRIAKDRTKALGDEILTAVRAMIAQAAGGDPRLLFKLNRWVYARLQQDERKVKTVIKVETWALGNRLCVGCGKKFRTIKGVHLHRVDPTRPYGLENCQLVCRACHPAIENDSPVMFSIKRLNRAIELVRHAMPGPEDMTEGWRISPFDPARLVAGFDCLAVKKGFTLHAYQYYSAGNGNGFVYALPAGAPFPEPYSCPTNRRHFLNPPVPPGALKDVMQGVEGDGSLWSYLAASILKRELTEFGAMWHGCDWSTHEILRTRPEFCQQPDVAGGPKSTPADEDRASWRWLETEPVDWRPSVCAAGNRIVVNFYTFSPLGSESIYRHEDNYKRGSYVPNSICAQVAQGPGGMVF